MTRLYTYFSFYDSSLDDLSSNQGFMLSKVPTPTVLFLNSTYRFVLASFILYCSGIVLVVSRAEESVQNLPTPTILVS